MLSLIPEPKRAPVEAGLLSAFGATELDSPPVMLTGGLSGAVMLRIRVGGIDYALKIEGPPGPFSNVRHAYECMQMAADLMLAPRVWYADPAEGVAILDLLPQRPFSQHPGGRDGLLVDLAQTVRALHQAPPFPRALEVLDGVDAFISPKAVAGLVAPAELEALFAGHARLRTVYRTRDGDRVSSHLDLNPANILFDGRRVWLIDWYSAFVADRYSDLATLVNWLASDPAGEALLTTTYFGAPMDAEQAARLYVMRQSNHLFLGALFLIGAAAERRDGMTAASLFEGPGLAELRERLKTGAFGLTAWENRVAYGRARLAEALTNMRGEAFDAALAKLAA